MLRKIILGSALSLVISGYAAAADLPYLKAPPYLSVPTFTWTGFYLGGTLGAAMHSNKYTDNDDWYNGYGVNYNSNSIGAAFGVEAGYNYQIGPNFVLGVETDIQYSTGKGTVVINGCNDECAGVITHANWMGSFRGRIGYAFDRVLAYGTAGLAYGNPASTWYEDSNPDEFDRKGWRVGYAAGLGIEYAVTNNWTVKAEGIYYDLGKQTVRGITEPDYTMGVENSQMVVRFGANYKF